MPEKKTLNIRPGTYWELKRLALAAQLNIMDYMDFLVKSELARQSHPGVLIDTPVVYGPGRGYNTTGEHDETEKVAP